MTRQSATGAADRWFRSRDRRLASLEDRTATAFTLAGLALLASLFVPVGLSAVTDWAWVAGLALVGVGVLATVTGLLGLYPGVSERAMLPASAGLFGAAVAGAAALALLAMAGVALVGGAVLGAELGKPTAVFTAVALSMAGGLTLGYLAFGLAGWRAGHPSCRTGQLLAVAGLLLLVPTLGELLEKGVGVRPPAWLFLPVLVLVALDTLAVGNAIRRSP